MRSSSMLPVAFVFFAVASVMAAPAPPLSDRDFQYQDLTTNLQPQPGMPGFNPNTFSELLGGPASQPVTIHNPAYLIERDVPHDDTSSESWQISDREVAHEPEKRAAGGGGEREGRKEGKGNGKSKGKGKGKGKDKDKDKGKGKGKGK